jgi:hypothetical protein
LEAKSAKLIGAAAVTARTTPMGWEPRPLAIVSVRTLTPVGQLAGYARTGLAGGAEDEDTTTDAGVATSREH